MANQPKTDLRRMWVNQPSTHDQHHNLHGTNVLAHLDFGNTYRVYFLSGDVISSQMLASQLSDGWKPDAISQPVLSF